MKLTKKERDMILFALYASIDRADCNQDVMTIDELKALKSGYSKLQTIFDVLFN